VESTWINRWDCLIHHHVTLIPVNVERDSAKTCVDASACNEDMAHRYLRITHCREEGNVHKKGDLSVLVFRGEILRNDEALDLLPRD